MSNSCESLCQQHNKRKSLRNSLCSCSNCDSLDCFELRHHATRCCVCETCENPKTCVLIKNRKTASDNNNVLKQIYSAGETQHEIIIEMDNDKPECKRDCIIEENNAKCKEILKNKQPGKIVNENKEDDKSKSREDNTGKTVFPHKCNLKHEEGENKCPQINQPKFNNHPAKDTDDSNKKDDIGKPEITIGESLKGSHHLADLWTHDNRHSVKSKERKYEICKTCCNKSSLKFKRQSPEEKCKNELEKALTFPIASQKPDQDSAEIIYPMHSRNLNKDEETKGKDPSLHPVIKSRRIENCACTDCDSFTSFEFRHRAATVCVYETCRNSKSCPLYKNRISAVDNTTPVKKIFSASETQNDTTVKNLNCDMPECEQYCDVKHLDGKLDKKIQKIKQPGKVVDDNQSKVADKKHEVYSSGKSKFDKNKENVFPPQVTIVTIECNCHSAKNTDNCLRYGQNLDKKESGKYQDKICKTCHMDSNKSDRRPTEINKDQQTKKYESCFYPVCSNEKSKGRIEKSVSLLKCDDILCKQNEIMNDKSNYSTKLKLDDPVILSNCSNSLDLKKVVPEAVNIEQQNGICKSNCNSLENKNVPPEQNYKELAEKPCITLMYPTLGKTKEKSADHCFVQKVDKMRSAGILEIKNGKKIKEKSMICKSECQKCYKLRVKTSCQNRSQCHYQSVRKSIKCCPAYCPTCHKLYIDEHNEDYLAKKTKVSLKLCLDCRNIIPKIVIENSTENSKPLRNQNKTDLKEEKKCLQSKKNKIGPEDLIITDEAGGTESIIVQTACRATCFAKKNEGHSNCQKAYPIRKIKINSLKYLSSKGEDGSLETSNIKQHKGLEKTNITCTQCTSEGHPKKNNTALNKGYGIVCCKSLPTDKNIISARQFKPYSIKNNKIQDSVDMMIFIKECVRKEIEDIRRSLNLPTNKVDKMGNNTCCCLCPIMQPTINNQQSDPNNEHKLSEPNKDRKPLEPNVDNKNSIAFIDKMKDVIYKEIKDIKDSISKHYDNTGNKVDEDNKTQTKNKIEERVTAKVENPTATKTERLYKSFEDPSTKAESSAKMLEDPTTTKAEISNKFLPFWSNERKCFERKQMNSRSLTLQANNCEIKLRIPNSKNNDKSKDQHYNCMLDAESSSKEKGTIKNKNHLSSASNTNATLPSNKYGATDELTAQVMNVPFKEYRESVTRPDVKRMRSIELFRMVREIYKECSCKVCQCISSGLTMGKSEVCDCKPCDCPECRARIAGNNIFVCATGVNSKSKTYKDRKTHSSECQCKPCDCIKCKEAYLLKSCNCKYCTCIDCKSMSLKQKRSNYEMNFIIAPVRESLQRPYCRCSPCGCFECAHPFGNVAPTYNTQETGTDERRHMNCNCDSCANENCEREGADTCTCDRQSKIIKKPVTSNKNDYDIHYYTSLSHNLFHPYKTKTDNAYSSGKNVANLEYSNYKCSKTVSDAMFTQDCWKLRANTALIANCDCKPCECQKCRKHFLERHIPHRRSSRFCEICDCINCATLSMSYGMGKKYGKKLDLSQSIQYCDCKPCRCNHCSKYMIMSIQDKHRQYRYTTLDEDTLIPLEDNTGSHSCQTLIEVTDSERFIDLVLSDKETRNRDLVKNESISLRTQVSLSDSEHLKQHCANQRVNSIITHMAEKEDSGTNPNKCQNESTLYRGKIKNREDKIILDAKIKCQISDHLMTDSIVSSEASSSGQTDIIENDNKKLNKQELATESSCNSSGHDDSEYLIRLPTSTVETCINDVMSLPMYNKPDKNNLEATMNILNPHNNLPFLDLQYFNTNDTLQSNDTIGKLGENLNSEKMYDCDSCIQKTPKFGKCRCDCAACRCEETCLSENRSALLRKNKNTQTTKSMLDSEDFAKELPSLLKKLNVTFSNNDRIVRWTDFPLRSFQHDTRNNTAMTDFPPINYDSVRKTIKEAKQFSLELLNILQKYEKANRDFDSMTKKFKTLNESVVGEVDTQKQNKDQSSYQVAFIKTISKYPSLPDTKNNIIYNSTKTDSKEYNLMDKQILQSCYQVDSKCESSYPSQPVTKTSEIHEHTIVTEFEVKEKTICAPIPDRTTNYNQDDRDVVKNDNLDQMRPVEINNQCMQIEPNTKLKLIKINADMTAKAEEKLSFDKLKSEYQKYSQHLDKVIDKCKRNQWGMKKSDTKSGSHGLSENSPIQRPSRTREFINKNNSDLNTVFICQSRKDDAYQFQKIKPSILNIRELDSLKQIIVPKKKAYVAKSSETSHKAQMCHASHDVQSQTRLCRIFESAPSMANKRLQLKTDGTKSTFETSVTNDLMRKNSYDPMKVVFQMVRKVSDHSILVKWKIPDVATNIKGYEILVDGRSIQKILSPNKNMAVLTCLPHAEKVKMTVRTITNTPDGHSPCATVFVCTRS